MWLGLLTFMVAAVAFAADLVTVGEVVWRGVRRLSRKDKSRHMDGS
jgi:hypothetical protein